MRFGIFLEFSQTLINSHQTKLRETQTNHFLLLRTMMADSDGDSVASITDSEEEAVQVFFGFGVPSVFFNF